MNTRDEVQCEPLPAEPSKRPYKTPEKCESGAGPAMEEGQSRTVHLCAHGFTSCQVGHTA